MPKKFIPYGTQSIDAADIREVTRVLRSSWLTQGPQIRRFEQAFAKYVGAPYAVAVSSGTAGLHLACLAAGFGQGDEVVTSPNTFVATSNSVIYAGATPRFADIDERTLGMDVQKAAAAANGKAAGFIPVHFAGQPADVHFKRGKVIEDACHALGAEVNKGGWKKIGSCQDSDMAVFSFHPVKHVATGEGGMITTRNENIYQTLLLLRSHGIEKQPVRFKRKQNAGKPWQHEMQMLGFNYRITDFQCALGFSQLKKLPDFLARRREIAAIYDKAFSGASWLSTPATIPATKASYHLYVLRIRFNKIGIFREKLMEGLKKEGIGTQVHYIPVPSQPYYEERFGNSKGRFPVAEKYYEEALSIPMYPALTNADCQRVIRAVLRHGRKGMK